VPVRIVWRDQNIKQSSALTDAAFSLAKRLRSPRRNELLAKGLRHGQGGFSHHSFGDGGNGGDGDRQRRFAAVACGSLLARKK
jgi:hypothetical protein